MVIVLAGCEDHMHRADVVGVEWLDQVGGVGGGGLAVCVPARLDKAGVEGHAALATAVVALLKAAGAGGVALVVAGARVCKYM